MSTDEPASSNSGLTPDSGPTGVADDTYRLSSPSPMLIDPDTPPVLVTPRPVPKKGAAKKARSADVWALCGLNLLVFLTSVCVMTLELTASRLIAKTVGSSLYTWTSVIGVVLAGITLGNFLGGWLADRFDRGRALAWMYLFGSISCASVLWMDQLVGPISRPSMFSWPTWVLTVVSIMFLLPSLALGTISPLVASMALSRSVRVGKTVGNVYAWGALGSILGTFLTGFYLMDVWGTRTIIGMTATTLGVLAAVVAGAPRLFRTAVVCGWLQLLGWTVLAATCTTPAMAHVAESFGTLFTISQTRQQATETRSRWRSFGDSLGTKLHELGLVLKLRDDRIGAYYDESNYSTIMVTEGEHQGRSVKHLRLDKLIHSYYDEANPTALHYEYEQVYAAVTKRTARLLTQPVTLSTTALPNDRMEASQLPAGTTFDAATATLKIEQPTRQTFDDLLKLAPDAAFWLAVEELHKETNQPLWGGFAAVPVADLPQGIVVPDDLSSVIRYDKSLEVVTAYDVVTAQVRDRLIRSTPLAGWYQEVERARGQSRRATGMFIGGGGFIFPRWFVKEFPGSPRVEVAELDSAVYKVACEALGLTGEEQQRILTSIGDARNVVDDRLRENQRQVAAGQTPVLYDFIYGDAFNDFSIPAHLTTHEFLQKLHDLLSEDGVFQANIIDIYPRVEYPGSTVGVGEADYQGPLPTGLAGKAWTIGQYASAGTAFAPLEIKSYGNGQYRVRATGLITVADERRLVNVDLTDVQTPTMVTNPLAADAATWRSVIESIASQTRERKTFNGSIPSSLKANDDLLEAWIPSATPWECVEIFRAGSPDGQTSRYSLGFRGIISLPQQNELVQLDPNNREWTTAVRESCVASRKPGPGRFLGRYVATAARVFPNIYLFSTSNSQPNGDRDTFVMVCSRRPLELKNLADTGDWTGDWFAALETKPGESKPTYLGQMAAVLTLSEGQILTDDFAPVDNLLRPVFADQQ
ncbi:MAG: spermidine synthase [Planctomycetes bacterium]|nr:spermidine synthase [Planctomycetota bacterium]